MALVQTPIPGLLVQDFSESEAMHLLGMALWDATVANTSNRDPSGLAWTLHEVLTKEELDTLRFPPTDMRQLAARAWS